MDEFIPPSFDRLFKAVFANPHRPEPLRSFLGSVLEAPDDLVDLSLVDTHLPPLFNMDKESVVDVRARTRSGRDINVEIQVAPELAFRERLVYYASNIFATKLPIGRPYSDLTQVISVAITNHIVIPDDRVFHHRFQLHDKIHDVDMTDVLEFNFLELPKLTDHDDQTLLWKWLRFLSVRSWKELHMVAQLDSVIAEAADEVERFNQDQAIRFLYLQRDRAERDAATRRVEEERRKAEQERREAEFAQREAEEEKREAEFVRRKTEEEKREAAFARREAEFARHEAEFAQREAEFARNKAEAERHVTELEHREAELQQRVLQLQEQEERARGLEKR